MTGRIVLDRRYRFSASHLYRRADWDAQTNERVFGLCARLPSHGHNYRLWVAVEGPVDPETGFLCDLGELDAIVGRRVLAVLDHTFLNESVEEFRGGAVLPTGENLARWIAAALEGHLPPACRLFRLRVAEDEDLAAEWWPSGA